MGGQMSAEYSIGKARFGLFSHDRYVKITYHFQLQCASGVGWNVLVCPVSAVTVAGIGCLDAPLSGVGWGCYG